MYGEQDVFPAPEDHSVKPESPYGLAKAVGEMYLDLFARLYGFRWTSLRYANVYGPRQSLSNPYAGVAAIWLSQRRCPARFRAPSHTRSMASASWSVRQVDGSLGLPDSALRQLDWVIASIHTSFNMTRKNMTERMVAAVQHPLVDALGHPTGCTGARLITTVDSVDFRGLSDVVEAVLAHHRLVGGYHHHLQAVGHRHLQIGDDEIEFLARNMLERFGDQMSEEERREEARTIRRAVGTLARLVDDVLVMGRSEAAVAATPVARGPFAGAYGYRRT